MAPYQSLLRSRCRCWQWRCVLTSRRRARQALRTRRGTCSPQPALVINVVASTVEMPYVGRLCKPDRPPLRYSTAPATPILIPTSTRQTRLPHPLTCRSRARSSACQRARRPRSITTSRRSRRASKASLDHSLPHRGQRQPSPPRLAGDVHIVTPEVLCKPSCRINSDA